MNKIPIVFFGTGPVAARSLELLLSNFDIVGVVTKPRPEHHRGGFPVVDTAEKLGLPLHFVQNKRELSDLIAERPFDVELAILIDFGIIVARDVIDSFPLGIINSHFSLLPELRGADPITFAILSGQKKTGVSLMLIDEGMDTGLILACGVHELDGTETTPDLTDQLIGLSDALLKKEVPRYLSGETKGVAQEELAKLIPDHPAEPTYSRKITKEDGAIDWNKPAEQIEREIRAFKDWPKSYTQLADIDVIITSSSVADLSEIPHPGQIKMEQKRLFIGTADGWLEILSCQVAGKKDMPVQAFLAGYSSRLS